ncbi:hypothetical protein A2U01_0105353, partial [Trifolium medium]|nr:hypothetical protein [Trifolium medium]
MSKEGHDENLSASSPSLNDVVNNLFSVVTLTSPPQPLPGLLLDVIEEILCRIPVKLL